MSRVGVWIRYQIARLRGTRDQCRNCGAPLFSGRHNGQFCSESCDQEFAADTAW